jgi:hypothetical protein
MSVHFWRGASPFAILGRMRALLVLAILFGALPAAAQNAKALKGAAERALV